MNGEVVILARSAYMQVKHGTNNVLATHTHTHTHTLTGTLTEYLNGLSFNIPFFQESLSGGDCGLFSLQVYGCCM